MCARVDVVSRPGAPALNTVRPAFIPTDGGQTDRRPAKRRSLDRWPRRSITTWQTRHHTHPPSSSLFFPAQPSIARTDRRRLSPSCPESSASGLHSAAGPRSLIQSRLDFSPAALHGIVRRTVRLTLHAIRASCQHCSTAAPAGVTLKCRPMKNPPAEKR